MGLQIVTTVTKAASSQDLTNLANARTWLGIPDADTSHDSFLTLVITQASQAMANKVNRVFAVEGLTDLIYLDQDPYPYQVPGGVAPLQLSRWPVVNVSTLPLSAASATGDTVLHFASTAGAAADYPASGAGIDTAASVASVVTDTSVTLSEPITTDLAAGSLVTFGLAVAQTIAAGDLQGLVLNTDYAVAADTGELSRLNPFTGVTLRWEALPVTVRYRAGFATVPADLEGACLKLVLAEWGARGRDPMLREIDQPNLGRKVYWVGGPPGSGGMPDTVMDVLENYRTPIAL